MSRSVTQFRSPSERGEDWVSEEQVNAVVEAMKTAAGGDSSASSTQYLDPTSGSYQNSTLMDPSAEPSSSSSSSLSTSLLSVPARVIAHPNLPVVWRRLGVRVMSGRNHDMGNSMMNSFYTDDVSTPVLCLSSLSRSLSLSLSFSLSLSLVLVVLILVLFSHFFASLCFFHVITHTSSDERFRSCRTCPAHSSGSRWSTIGVP